MFGEMEIRFAANTYKELVQKIAQWLEKEAAPAPQQAQPTYTPPYTPPYTPQQAAPVQTQPQAPAAAAPLPVFMPPSPACQPVQPPPVVPTAAPTYQLEDIMQAASRFCDVGPDKHQAVTGLMAQFGVQALHQLPPERLGEFAAALRGLGAQL